MPLSIHYVISKGSKPVGENGFTTNPSNIKKFSSIEEAYHWLSILPGLRGKEKALRKEFEQHLERKVERDLL